MAKARIELTRGLDTVEEGGGSGEAMALARAAAYCFTCNRGGVLMDMVVVERGVLGMSKSRLGR